MSGSGGWKKYVVHPYQESGDVLYTTHSHNKLVEWMETTSKISPETCEIFEWVMINMHALFVRFPIIHVTRYSGPDIVVLRLGLQEENHCKLYIGGEEIDFEEFIGGENQGTDVFSMETLNFEALRVALDRVPVLGSV